MMLQQTQVATVLHRRYFDRWLEQFPTLAALAAAPEEEVLRAWEGLGYYRRARNLQRTAKVVCQEQDGVLPSNVKLLRQLPGLGAYTAGAVATFAFDLAEPIVDANIARVLARLFAFAAAVDSEPGKSQIWQWAAALVPQHNARAYNSALMELGQTICIPGHPQCTDCPVQQFCAGKLHHPEQLPVKRPKRDAVRVLENAILAVRGGKILLHQAQGNRCQGLWKLPERSETLLTQCQAPLLLKMNYSITHHRVRLHVYQLDTSTPASDERWHDLLSLPALPMPSPYRKALERSLFLSNQSQF